MKKLIFKDNMLKINLTRRWIWNLWRLWKKLFGGPEVTTGSNRPHSDHKKQADKFYDEIYFDSDDSDGEQLDDEGKQARQSAKLASRGVVSDEELLYDPHIDDDNQNWVDTERRKQHTSVSNDKGISGLLPRSDAVLNCPACMTCLTRDCQRHDHYSSQYRAMFVMNCHVDFSTVLKQPKPEIKKKKKGKKQKNIESEKDTSSSDIFHSVKCDMCKTNVGVYDLDEVFHFFNVIASHV